MSLINYDTCPGESQLRGRVGLGGEESYPFQIAMYHSLIVHVPASDVFELRERFVGEARGHWQNWNLQDRTGQHRHGS